MNEASYPEQLANLKRWLIDRHGDDPERCLHFFASMLLDTTSDETAIQEAARPVLGDWVDGDSYSVPGPVEIVERLVQEIKR